MRVIICFTERSRSGLAMRPRKYFCATMFVAVCDQNFGNSTFFCSNVGPFLPGMLRVADLPVDLVERVAAFDREQSADGEAGVLVDDPVGELVGLSLIGLNLVCFLLCGRHLSLSPPAVGASISRA